MAVGYAHLFSLPVRSTDSEGVVLPLYQFTFNAGGDAYSKVFDEPHLVEFLTEDLGLVPDILNSTINQLHSLGNSTILDLDFSENDAAAMGMEKVGADY
jgi:hypothetical protein